MTYQPTPQDFQTLVQLSQAQNPPIDPTQVAIVLFEESGFDPSRQNNSGTGNYGLNQMSTANIQALGLSVSDWTSMTAAEQLQYVFRFWSSSAASANSGQFPSDGGTLLAMNFEPGAFQTVGAGSNPDAVLAGASGPYATNYAWNKVLDPNGTGEITVNTCRQYVSNLLSQYAGNSQWQAIQAGIASAGGNAQPQPQQPQNPVPTPNPSSMLSTLALAIVGGLAIGGAAHILLPKPAPRRRYRYA